MESLTYRKCSEELRDQLGLRQVPHCSTIMHFADRSNTLQARDAILPELEQSLITDKEQVAIDSTGLETTSASSYLQACSGKTYKKYVKLSDCILCTSLIPTSIVLGWGPGNDKSDARALLVTSHAARQPQKLFANAGYDAEWAQEYCREKW